MEDCAKERVSPAWVARYLGLPSEDSVWREARLGRIPHKRIGRRVLFYRDALEQFRQERDSALFRSTTAEKAEQATTRR